MERPRCVRVCRPRTTALSTRICRRTWTTLTPTRTPTTTCSPLATRVSCLHRCIMCMSITETRSLSHTPLHAVHMSHTDAATTTATQTHTHAHTHTLCVCAHLLDHALCLSLFASLFSIFHFLAGRRKCVGSSKANALSGTTITDGGNADYSHLQRHGNTAEPGSEFC